MQAHFQPNGYEASACDALVFSLCARFGDWKNSAMADGYVDAAAPVARPYFRMTGIMQTEGAVIGVNGSAREDLWPVHKQTIIF